MVDFIVCVERVSKHIEREYNRRLESRDLEFLKVREFLTELER